MKVLKRASGAVTVFMTAIFVMGQNAVLAADPTKSLEKSGINPSTGDMSGIYDVLTGMVYGVMALSGFWVVITLIISGMKQSGSGGNAQKRTEVLIALVAAVSGAYVIFKAWVLGMEDMEEWLEDVVELVNRVQALIDKVRHAHTTETSLTYVTEVIRAVWPTLLTWMDIEDTEPTETNSFTSDVTHGTWSESAEEAAEHSLTVLERYDSLPTDEQDEEGTSKFNGKDEKQATMIRLLEKSLERDIAEVKKEMAEESPSMNKVTFKGNAGEITTIVHELPMESPNLETYRYSLSKVQRYIILSLKSLRLC